MFVLPRLPYDYTALAPVIGEETMRTHHGKHHARYVQVVNELTGNAAADVPLEDVIAGALERGEQKLFNNAAQSFNHAFFWESMAPRESQPEGELLAAIESAFGGLAQLRQVLVTQGAGHFGSGWVWLMATAGGKLEVAATHDAGQPWVGTRDVPLLVCDLWEHAYYLDYKNERDRFIGAWFDCLANWQFAAAQLAAAARGGRGYRYPPQQPRG
jgi:Fe-Mn family superoxide dismutase